MKLWQKIFIITLILTLAGTQLTAYLIGYRNFRHSVDAERERLARACFDKFMDEGMEFEYNRIYYIVF